MVSDSHELYATCSLLIKMVVLIYLVNYAFLNNNT